ncbi:acetylcholine receptor subunit beta-type lev-1-like [Mytilus trossulus]|uniref:acetylcholine receptor subunit beta-type lev-1-like n=1 Tax=Mytilus trossulus TaxID=6551 RepID=UPI0030067E30
MTFYMMSINKFEEIDETIEVLGGLHCEWNDAGISWNPNSYGNIPYTIVSSKHIWKPPMILVNAVDNLAPIGGSINNLATIYSDGNVTLGLGGILSAKCTTDISKFPYDSQTCNLKFAVWGLSNETAVLTESSDPISMLFYTPNSNWDLTSYHSRAVIWNHYSTFEIFLTIKRESLYYSVMVVCPTTLFGLLNPLVFLLPVESGERIGLGMTILLSYAIFLTLVSAAIPASSNPMCYLLIIMIMTIVISGVIVVMSIFITYLYYRADTKEMNAFWKLIGSRLPWTRKNNIVTVVPITEEKHVICKTSPLPGYVSWKDVSYGLDILFLIVSYVTMLCLITTFHVIVS